MNERSIKMAKGRKKTTKKKKKNTRKPRGSSRGTLPRTRSYSPQGRISQEKKRMLSILNFDEHLRGQVEDMFNINLNGLPPGKEPVFFSKAVFKIDNAELAMTEVGKLSDVDVTEETEEGVRYVWTRAYPKGHWNPLAGRLGARQVIGHIEIVYDNTLKLETQTKGWMTALIYHVISVLGREIKLTSLEFQNPMDMFRRQ
jgi:hypothetical protein